jgi:mRNA interferase RelE/StbE
MYQVEYSKNALKDLRRLDESVAKRIVEKIHFFSKQSSHSDFSKALKALEGKFRFRIGDYRAIFSIGTDGTLQLLKILNIKHRREIYRQD